MTTIAMAVRGHWNPWRLVRAVIAAVRERFAEGKRLSLLAAEYRARPTLERARGVHYSSHRAPRVRRQRTARAPKAARHTPAPGRQRYALPADWLKGRFEFSHRMAWARPTVREILAGV